MKIRSITYFDNIQWPLDRVRIQQADEFISAARKLYEDGGFEVQTTRIATPPFPQVLLNEMQSNAVLYAKALEEQLIILGFDYISIGPAIPEAPWSYTVIPEILENTQTIFSAGIMSSAGEGIAFKAIDACAMVIKQTADITPDGFTNLRFAALANVPPGSPFLPAAYHKKNGVPSFAIAIEAGDLAVDAVQQAASLQDLRRIFIDTIEKQAETLALLAKKLSKKFGAAFLGIDFSLAPYPKVEQSIGTAIELMGVPAVGGHGSLAAVAILADLLDQAQFQKVGFNGVMLPVMEDSSLAMRVLGGDLEIKDLLLYSTVCGTGLDTIPLPGEVTQEQLYAILLDLAVLAQRLGKPLTARMMPVPGKLVGDATDFDFEYFANSRVMDLKAQPLTGIIAQDENYHLARRQIREVDQENYD